MSLNDNTPATTGAAFADDAMPLADLTPGRPRFDVRDGTVFLRGSRSRSSGSLAFPERQVCLVTGARDMEPMTFGPRGVLYSYSVVHLSATRKVPYTIGYVDFDNGVRVLAQVVADPAQLRCDLPVEVRAEGGDWFVVPAGTASDVPPAGTAPAREVAP